MGKGQIKDEEAFWHSHIRGWEQGSLSQAAYCLEQGISFATFGYWRRRYNKERRPRSQTAS